MTATTAVAFKEWAIVVHALAVGDQTLILRKGGISENGGGFALEHHRFWLFPTRFHEAEDSVIPSSRATLQHLAAQASDTEVEISCLAVAEAVVKVTDLDVLKQLQGKHIWSEHILEQRFHFGREPGLHVVLVRVYRRNQPVKVRLLPSYGGCKSWVALADPIDGDLTPVLSDAAFRREREEFDGKFFSHACSHS